MTRGSLVLLAVVLAARGAAAQPAAPNPAADTALAEGRRLYDLQEWDQAIAKFKEAYRLREDAPALFNIAQSYRLKGDCASAASFYKTFKRKFPAEKNLDKVEKFIVEMEACAKAAPAKTTPTTTTPTTTTPIPNPGTPDPTKTAITTTSGTPEPTTTTTTTTTTTPATIGSTTSTSGTVGGVATTIPAPASPGKELRLTGMIVGGVGAVALGAGAFFGVRARSAASDAQDLAPGSTWMPGIEERGEQAEKKAKIFLIAGGVAVVTGTVLFTLGVKKGKEASSVSFVPEQGGASMAWATAF